MCIGAQPLGELSAVYMAGVAADTACHYENILLDCAA